MRAALGLALALLLAGCASATSSPIPATTASVSTIVEPGSATPESVDLAVLRIDDHPMPGHPYLREEWPTWKDIDGDGCDAREQALAAQSVTPAQVSFPGCQVVAGNWVSAYDGVETSSPSDLDADHLVPLENVHESGGWAWDAASRVAYANDQAVLVMVTAHANRSKGSKSPDEWLMNMSFMSISPNDQRIHG